MALTEKNYLPFFAISLKKCVLLINEKIIELIESQKIEILDQCENLVLKNLVLVKNFHKIPVMMKEKEKRQKVH